MLAALVARGLVKPPADPEALVEQATAAALPLSTPPCASTPTSATGSSSARWSTSSTDPDDPGYGPQQAQLAAISCGSSTATSSPRAAETYTRLVLEELLERADVTDPAIVAGVRAIKQLRRPPGGARHRRRGPTTRRPACRLDHRAAPGARRDPDGAGEALRRAACSSGKDRPELVGFGAELDQAVQMPGWTNVWTMPIQNRVDMLATGVNTAIGVRVLGRKLDDVVRVSEAVAAVLKRVPGAVGRGRRPRPRQGLRRDPDRPRARRRGRECRSPRSTRRSRPRSAARSPRSRWRAASATPSACVTAATGGRMRTRSATCSSPPCGRKPTAGPRLVPLAEVADVRVVEGPATIKSENGLLRNYVRLNVRDANAADFVARRPARLSRARSSSRKGRSSNGPASSSTRPAPRRPCA